MDDFVELSQAECRDLLETDTVGRVAFLTPGGPRIVPVNFALAGEPEPRVGGTHWPHPVVSGRARSY